MAKDHGPSIKNDDKYEKLREKGMSKEKAARIANSPAQSSRKGGKAPSYEDWSEQELYDRAKEIGIEGRSAMSKSELITALRKGRSGARLRSLPSGASGRHH